MEKIQDREWVIIECQRRIPSSYEEIKLLLEYGLKNCFIKNKEKYIYKYKFFFMLFLEKY